MLEICAKECPANTHQPFIEDKIPAWLTQASPARRLALRRTPIAIPDWYRVAPAASHRLLAQAVEASWLSQAKVDRLFEPVSDVRRFAEPLLHQALKDRFGVELDVNRTCLRLYLAKGSIGGFQVKTLSLLDAALHNFESKESIVNYFDSASCFISEPNALAHFEVLTVNSRISISAFVSLCRELDIGGQYSRRLESLLLPADAVAIAVLELRVKTSQQDAFRAAVLLARMKGDIGPDTQASLLQLLDGASNGAPQCYRLQIMGARLTGIMLLATDLECASTAVPLVAYIPDDPQHPIKEYPSTQAFSAALTEQLRSAAYQRFFARFVAHERRGYFFSALDGLLNVVKWHPHQPNDPRPTWRRTPVASPNMHISVRRVAGDPWRWLYRDTLNKILNDARVMAVPTEDEDRQSRWALWDSLENVASIVLQVASLAVMPFVPFLGELMLAYTTWQLLDETFTGVLDWAEGHRAEAADHLLSIAENLAQLAAFGTAGAVAGKLLAIKPSAFVEKLKPVVLEDGRTRLWNPDLQPYEQGIPLPAESVPDEAGLHRRGGKTLLALEDRTYEVGVEPDSGAYHVRHPQRADAYRPRLSHNGAGAWAHEVERPMEWQGAQLFRRLGHSVADFSDETTRRILAVSGIDEAMLRHLHVHARRPPALLDDTIRRFRFDAQILTLRAQLASLDRTVYAKADVKLQLQLLETQGVSVSEVRLRDGDVIAGVLELLDEGAQKKLLGLSPAPGDSLPAPHVRAALLRSKMAGWAEEYRGQLFRFLEDSFESGADTATQKMRRIFPDLPRVIAEELWREASVAERLHLNDGPGMARRMAHEALFYLREVRLGRACEGLYLDSVVVPDTDKLALHMLETLSGWSSEVRIEVRDSQFDGALLDSIGSTEAPVRKVLVRQQGRYQARDSAGEQLHGFDDLYGAVMHALPDPQRLALGLPHVGQGAGLRQTVRQQTLPTRSQLRVLFEQPAPGARSPMSLAIGRTGYLLGGGDFVPEPRGSIDDRLRALFPTLSKEELASVRRERLIGDPLLAIARLENEYVTLVNDLEAWSVNAPTLHPLTGFALSAEDTVVQRQRRVLFAQEIRANWSRRLTESNRFDTGRFFSKLDILGELPRLSADFSHVSEFLLINSSGYLSAGPFLGNFANLKFLTMRGVRLEEFPSETYRMRQLVSLNFEHCNLRLDTAGAEGLALMDRLETLDLDNNPLVLAPYVGHMKGLTELRLSSTQLSEVPRGLFELEKLRYADLTGNQITQLPDELFEVDDVRGVEYNFGDNPLNDSSRQRVAEYGENSSLDRKLLIHIDESDHEFIDSDQESDTDAPDSGLDSSGEASEEYD